MSMSHVSMYSTYMFIINSQKPEWKTMDQKTDQEKGDKPAHGFTMETKGLH